MIYRTVRLVNLVLAGMLAGNEFGTWAAVHPSLAKLGQSERIRAEQELTRRFSAIMPLWMGSTVVSCVLALLYSRGSAGSRGTLVGTTCFAGMLASTRIGNVPINERVLEMDPETDQEEFAELRKRWDRLHTLRVVLSVVGLGSLVSGGLAEDRR
jgi:Anthrone oxygenase